jgi:aminopeptidase-like protein/aminoglycoside N3'-acetyltransferase
MNEKKQWHYNKESLVYTLREAGVKERDVIFSHVSLGRLGYPQEGDDIGIACKLLYEAFMEVLGTEGTLLIPTYTYSIGKREIYDVQNTPSTVGPFTEYFRKLPGVIRSRDPMLAVAGIGLRTTEFLIGLPHTCYGVDSVYDRIRKIGGKICNVGISLYWATFRHHIEEMAGVPFRFKKLFTGDIVDRGKMEHESWVYFVAPLIANCNPDGMRLDKKARALNKCKCVSLGRSEVICIDAQEYFDLGLEELSRDPWFTAQGPPCEIDEIIELENKRVGGKTYQVNLHADASMREIIESTWYLPRDVVSDGVDAAFEVIGQQVPMVIHKFNTGTEIGTQIIPEKWTCLEAYLETIAGQRVFSHADNYLHVASYSQPFESEIERAELFKHLVVHPYIEDAIPYCSLFNRRDWGLCCSEKMKKNLTDERYRVVIRTAFSFSAFKIGEVLVPGKSSECIAFCTHLDHPAQVNDGLSGVAVGIDAFRSIMRSNHHYSYLLIILPSSIGLAAYLEKRKELISTIKGFIILDMLGSKYPHLFELKSNGDHEVSRFWIEALSEVCDKADEIRIVSRNTESADWWNKFNINFPVLSILRSKRNATYNDSYFFPEHHSNFDSPELIDYDKLDKSRDLILELINMYESK